jgi:hopanoid-associated phosphorylase
VLTIASGDRSRLMPALIAAADAGARGIVSFGIAGGLDPALPAGTLVVASAVVAKDARYEADARWSQALLKANPGAVHGIIAGADAPVCEPSEKRALRETTGAGAVDMESHLVAAFAQERGLPFAAFRAIADSADRRLPKAVLNAMRPDGSADIGAVLCSLAREPSQLPDLIRTGFDTGRAKKALLRDRDLLGAGLGFDAGHHLLDVT